MTAVANAVERLAAALGGGAAATLAAVALIEAEVHGQPRFGLTLLDDWSSAAQPLPAIPPQAVVWRDGSAAFAPLAVAAAALDLGVAAREFGVAAVFLRGIKGFGRLAPFVRAVADTGLVALAVAEGPPFVAPHGGTRPVIGTNPLALAMGRGAEQVVIDLASSSTTMAAVRAARAEGRPLPEGIAVDAEGQPTQIAVDVAALLPRGGQVGSLLGLMVELLAGVAGAGRGDPQGRGVLLLAFDPAAADGWQSRLAALRHDWTGSGGHWPHGGRLPEGALLGAEAAARLETALARMTAETGQ